MGQSTMLLQPHTIRVCSSWNVSSEDCLLMKIWTPFLPTRGSAPSQDLKPFMFLLHGLQMPFWRLVLFGNIITMGYPLRDENDFRFEQFVLNAWQASQGPLIQIRIWACYKRGAMLTRWLRSRRQNKDSLMVREHDWLSKSIAFRDIE